MQIPPIQTNKPEPTFGVYKVTRQTHYGHKTTGVINGYKLDIYTGKEDGEIKHKLYYLSDVLGNWIKSKLVYFKNGKKIQTIRSEKL